MNVHDLTIRFVEVPTAAKPMVQARLILSQLSETLLDVSDALSYLTGTGGNALQSFYRAPDLSLLKVSFPGGRRTPPHNHGTWAAILVLSGAEKNTLYKRDSDHKLQCVGEVVLEAGSILPMPADVIHVAECLGDTPAVGLHVYGANVLGVERQMWDPDTLVEQPLDWELYEPLAVRASAADAAPLT